MRLPFKRLETAIVRAMKRSYREIIAERSDETLYAFGFFHHVRLSNDPHCWEHGRGSTSHTRKIQ